VAVRACGIRVKDREVRPKGAGSHHIQAEVQGRSRICCRSEEAVEAKQRGCDSRNDRTCSPNCCYLRLYVPTCFVTYNLRVRVLIRESRNLPDCSHCSQRLIVFHISRARVKRSKKPPEECPLFKSLSKHSQHYLSLPSKPWRSLSKSLPCHPLAPWLYAS
jgi:hypothetical protein